MSRPALSSPGREAVELLRDALRESLAFLAPQERAGLESADLGALAVVLLVLAGVPGSLDPALVQAVEGQVGALRGYGGAQRLLGAVAALVRGYRPGQPVNKAELAMGLREIGPALIAQALGSPEFQQIRSLVAQRLPLRERGAVMADVYGPPNILDDPMVYGPPNILDLDPGPVVDTGSGINLEGLDIPEIVNTAVRGVTTVTGGIVDIVKGWPGGPQQPATPSPPPSTTAPTSNPGSAPGPLVPTQPAQPTQPPVAQSSSAVPYVLAGLGIAALLGGVYVMTRTPAPVARLQRGRAPVLLTAEIERDEPVRAPLALLPAGGG